MYIPRMGKLGGLAKWWRGLSAHDEQPPGADHDFWYRAIGAMSSSGAHVTSASAMQTSAVYACVRVISETLASLPLHLYRSSASGAKERATDIPLSAVLHRRPNVWQSTMEFVELMQAHLLLRGNAYALIVPGDDGMAGQLIPVHPDMIVVEQLESFRLRYVLRNRAGATVPLLQDEVLHIRGLSDDGIVGMNPIHNHRSAIGLSIAAEEFGGKLFSNGVRLSGVLSHPGKLTDNAHARLKSSIREEYAGARNAAKVLLVEEGMKFDPISITPEDAQFLETRKFQVADIARIFRVPPHMIGDLERATFSNIEHQSLDFVQHTIRPWAVRWEQAIARSLLADTDDLFAEFALEGLLRGDAASRSAFYGSGITNGWLTRNEVRRLENLNPAAGLDEFLVPLNMTTQGQQDAESRQEPEPEESEQEPTRQQPERQST